MQISGNSNAYDGGQAQRLLAMALGEAAAPTRQDVPGESQESRGGPASGLPPGPPPAGASDQFSSQTLSSLISAQEQASGSGNALATQLIGSSDSNGDGLLSLSEIQSSLGDGGSNTTGLTAALGAIDKDGDGKLSADELTAALDSGKAKHAHHAHGGHHADGAGAASGTTPETTAAETTNTDDTGSPQAAEGA